MKWFARQAKEWGPLGVSLCCLGAIILAASVYFATPTALDIADGGPNIPPDLADHIARGIGMERGSSTGATPSKQLPRPTSYLTDRGIKYSFEASPNWSGRGTNPIEAIVMHVTGPGSCPGMTSWFKNPSAQASANFAVCKDGSVIQYVEVGDASWSAGIVNQPNLNNSLIASWVAGGINPNSRTVGIEVLLAPGEKLESYPAMQASLIELMRWLAATLSMQINRTTVIGHYEIDFVNRNSDPRCCYDLDTLVKLVNAPATASSTTPQTCTEFPCLLGSVWRMADGWQFDPVTGFWMDGTGIVQFGACNPDSLRWSPPIARWVEPMSAFFNPATSLWARAPGC